MTDDLDNSAPFDDGQGTRIAREQPPTGAGSEATDGATGGKPSRGNHEHESGYGGKKGQPKVPSDIPTSRR